MLEVICKFLAFLFFFLGGGEPECRERGGETKRAFSGSLTPAPFRFSLLHILKKKLYFFGFLQFI